MIRHAIMISILIALMVVTGVLAESYLDTLQIQIPNDSIYFKTGEFNGAFSINDVRDGDSARFECRQDVVFYSSIDTINIKCLQNSLPLRIVSPAQKTTLILVLAPQEDKSELLKKHPHFGSAPVDKAWSFVYSDSSETGLRELRNKYNLDTIAGTGNEIERIINLMMWAHRIVKHVGDSPNPDKRDALSILDICQREKRGVNCRMIATILNEAYLALGFKSRHITCLPFDKTDGDCHVIDIVFANTLDKWLMMDPTFAGYFMNQDSVPLSIEEIREKMVNGKRMLINPKLDWNGVPYDKHDYFVYLEKNLFRFSTPIESSFGYESKTGPSVYINLNPIGYDSFKTSSSDTTKYPTGPLINYYTDNAAFFWDKPK